MKIKLNSGNTVILEENGLRGFILTTTSENVNIIRNTDNAEIESLIIENEYRLDLKQHIEIKEYKYVVNNIRKGDGYYLCIQERATKTSQFIMPLLGHTYDYFDFHDSFYNSYISDDYQYIYLVYKFKGSEKYLELEERLTKWKGFQEIIDPNPEYVVIKFELPYNHHKDVKAIMRGKYSSISPTFKSKICIFHKFHAQSKTFKMLHRDNTLRDEMEKEFNCPIPKDIDLMTKPKLKDEIWNLERVTLKKVGITS